MGLRELQPRKLFVAIGAVLTTSGAALAHAGSPVYTDDSGSPHNVAVVGLNATNTTARYIVRFVEAPVALYNDAVAAHQSIAGFGPIPVTVKNGHARLDVKSAQAQSYAQFLKKQQVQHVSDLQAELNLPAGFAPVYSMQYALNAVVLKLTAKQATKLGALVGKGVVSGIERDRPQPLATDIGPGFIGAASVWWGTPAGQDTLFASGFDNSGGFKGDGVVIGDIDTGYNSLSPSFQPTDESGYTISNPLGAGTYLGQCNVANISRAGCNAKVIGVYDEIDLTGSCTGTCPSQFSVEDTQGHGSHTASTAAGDYRSATLAGYTAKISGVAPHANLVIYYACSPDPNVQCSTAATTASVDQAIQDGVVNALNYSISGGTDPWKDATSLAFLSAENAGIFVAAAAGNTSASVPAQVAGTANHWEPWVTTVAAGTHTGGAIAPNLSATGPGTPPSNVVNQPLTEGAGDTPPTATLAANIVLSPNFQNSNTSGNDGCNPYSAGQFTGAIALVSRGTCVFSTKVANAVTAGAIAVVISDNRPEAPLIPSVPGATVPVYSLTQPQGTNFKNFLSANSNSVPAVIPYPPTRQPQQPDMLAGFSLLGPVGINVIKPDVQAPGVDILAAIANDGSANGPNLVALYDGTSMATPHTTGSGALLSGLNHWTPMEIKSALMMTAKEAGLTKADGVTLSDYFDRGSGRLQDFPASTAGLVLDENALDFSYADPSAPQNGDPSTLNLASMQNLKCINSCSFTRTFTATANENVTWTVALTGDAGGNTTSSVSNFTVAAGATQPVTLTVNTSSYLSDGANHFGEMTLTPSDPTLATLHLPIAVAVPPPTIVAQPNPLAITNVGTSSASAQLTVSNIGGPTLNVSQDNGLASPYYYTWINQVTPFTYGYTSTQYAARVPGATDYFAADDFTVTGNSPVNLADIYVPGFAQPNGLSTFGANLQLHWRIYTDAAGKPSGNPDSGAALWSFDATASSPGVYVGAVQYPDDIFLSLATAGAPSTALPAGHYWLVVYPTFPCLGVGSACTSGQWYWLTSSNGAGSSAVNIAPQTPSPAWAPIDPSTGAGLAMFIDSQISCAAPTPPWLSQTGLPLTLGGLGSANVTVTATSPLGGTNTTAYLCLDSNDTNNPILPIQVNAAQ